MILGTVKTEVTRIECTGEVNWIEIPLTVENAEEDTDFACPTQIWHRFDLDLDKVKYLWFTAHDRPGVNRVKLENLFKDDAVDAWRRVIVDDGEDHTLENAATLALRKYAWNRNVVYVEVEYEEL